MLELDTQPSFYFKNAAIIDFELSLEDMEKDDGLHPDTMSADF